MRMEKKLNAEYWTVTQSVKLRERGTSVGQNVLTENFKSIIILQPFLYSTALEYKSG